MKFFEQLRSSLRFAFSPRDPVLVFHHIPKCGGTSVNAVLHDWFIVRRDYRHQWEPNYPPKINVARLRSCHCLCGHFELEGNYLHQRYPEVLQSDRYRLFTFVRDPLQLRLSLYRYEKKFGKPNTPELVEHLLSHSNYLSRRLPATADNFQQVLERYFFVGVVEDMPLSLNKLASMLGKRAPGVPWENRTNDDVFSSAELRSDLIEEFKANNALDYSIYNHCVERFHNS